jgi:hypothetical protein
MANRMFYSKRFLPAPIPAAATAAAVSAAAATAVGTWILFVQIERRLLSAASRALGESKTPGNEQKKSGNDNNFYFCVHLCTPSKKI